MTRRPLSRAYVWVVLFLLAAPAQSLPGTPPSSEIQITGLVRNALGAGIERTLVLLTPVGASESVRSAVTDTDGRYFFDDVPANTYRVTAIKDGYESAMGQLSTWIQSRVDLILVPAGSSRARPQGAAWVLSAPRRDILRDLEAVPLEDDESGTADRFAANREPSRVPSSTAEFFDTLDGEFRQSFTQTQPGSSSSAEVTGGNGTKTSLLLGSGIGRRARWDFEGEHEREHTSWRNADFLARQANAERVRVNLRYDTGKTSRLDMRAYYDYDSRAFEPASQSSLLDADRERSAWGYDAGWVGGLGDDSSLQVDLRYAGSAVYRTDQGRSERALSKSEARADRIEAGTNIWRTAASLSKRVSPAHQVNVGLNARMYSFEGRERATPSAAQDPALFTVLGREGWTVSVNAAESWRILEPLALDFGFDVSRGVYSVGRLRQAVIPQAGATYTPNPQTTVRGAVSYVALDRDVTTGDRDVPMGDGEPEPSSDRGSQLLGYRLRVERKMGERFLLILDAESRPFFYDPIGARWETPEATESARDLYLSDGGASLREVDLSVEARPGGACFGFGASAGRVEGRVAALVPDSDLTQTLSDGSVRYIVGHLNGSVERSGTDVRIDLTRLSEGDMTGGEPYSDRRLAVKVLQSLAFLHPGNTSWTLLLTYSSYVPVLEPDPGASRMGPSIRAAQNRISGGVSVKF